MTYKELVSLAISRGWRFVGSHDNGFGNAVPGAYVHDEHDQIIIWEGEEEKLREYVEIP